MTKMSLMRGVTGMAFAALFGAVALGVGQEKEPVLPEGPAKQLLDKACASCHSLDPVLSVRNLGRDGYADMVTSMMAYGAQVSEREFPTLVDYLFANLGAKPAAPAEAPKAAAEDPGKTLLDKACAGCHAPDLVKEQVFDSKAPYNAMVTKMIGYGAPVTNAQVPVLVDYLFKTYGKK